MITNLNTLNGCLCFYNKKFHGILHSNTTQDDIVFESITPNNTLAFYRNPSQNKLNGLKTIESLTTSFIFLNNRRIGHMSFVKAKRNEAQTSFVIFIDGQYPIEVYDIGIGDRFIFFYSNGVPIACAHHNAIKNYTIFANDEWITQVVATYLLSDMINGDKYALNYTTPNAYVVDKYDGNFISELIKDEPMEVRQQFQSLIHSKKDNEIVVKKAERHYRLLLYV